MRHVTILFLVMLLGAATGLAEEAARPETVLDAEDLRIQRIETACDTYVLICPETKSFVVVDPGMGVVERVADLEQAGHALEAVWITHEHGDHVAGLGALAKVKQVPILAHADAKKGIESVRANWKDWGMTEFAPIPPVLPDTLVGEGDKATVGRLVFDVLHLPGHSAGSIGFLLPGRVLVVGDVLFKDSIGRTDLPTSAPEVFKTTLGKKLWDLPDATLVLPGHGETTTIGREKKSNWLFQDFAHAGRGEPPVARPWMGIRVDPEFEGPGVRLGEVTPDSPSAKAGLLVGDVILVFDGTKLESPRDLVAVIHRHGIGDVVQVKVKRGVGEKELTFTFGARPPV